MKFKIKSESLIHDLFFKIRDAVLNFDQFDGSISNDVRRFAIDKGPAVAGILHLTDTDEFVFVEQFRYPMTLVAGESAWVLEVVAGVMEEGLTEEQTIRKEIQEEAGYEVEWIEKLQDIFPSPGILSEKISLFYAKSTSTNTVPTGDPYDDEEDIRVHRYTIRELKEMLQMGNVGDAKTLICIQQILLNYG